MTEESRTDSGRAVDLALTNPPILEKIFSNLPPDDIRTVALVSR